MATYHMKLLSRVPLIVAGGYAMWWQVQLIRESAGANTTMLWIAPAACLIGALCPGWMETAWRERRIFGVLGWTIVLVISIGMSLSGALGRVFEMRAVKGAGAVTLSQGRAEAQRAVDQAEAAVARQQETAEKWCNTTTTQETYEKKRRTEIKVVDGRCKPAQDELAERRADLEARRAKLAVAPVAAKASADVNGIAAFLHLPAEEVEVYQPAGWPLFLELTMLLSFYCAFRPLEYDDDTEQPQRREWPANVVSLSQVADGLVQDIQVVAGLIKLWIEAEGLPADVPMKKACEQFNRWLKRQENIVGSRTFSSACKAAGVRTRSKGGNTLIAGPDYKPRKRKAAR